MSEPLENDELRFRTTPNYLTLFRILLVPVLVYLLFQTSHTTDVVAALVFGAAGFTDFLDGYLARKQGVVTVYGKLLDPLADKFLVVSALLMLQHLDRIHPILVILLVCRELGITGLRALASAEGIIIPASVAAKWKTGTQMVAIPFLMVMPGIWGIPLFFMGQILIYISLAVSMWSARDYVVDFLKEFARRRSEKRKNQLLKPEPPKVRTKIIPKT